MIALGQKGFLGTAENQSKCKRKSAKRFVQTTVTLYMCIPWIAGKRSALACRQSHLGFEMRFELSLT